MALLGEHRGSIQDSMPQCTTHTFLRMDTYNAAFDDVTLVNKFCSIAFNGTIMRTLIVSHGSGSLTVAQALHTGACQLGTRTAWYMASPPLAGSEVRPLPDAASFPLVGSPCCNAVASRACRWPCLPTTCARRPTLTRSKCATRCVWGGGRCPTPATYASMSIPQWQLCDGSSPSTGFTALAPSYISSFSGAIAIAKSESSGMMCGTAPSGIVSASTTALNSFASYFESPVADGIVAIGSCNPDGLTMVTDNHNTTLYSAGGDVHGCRAASLPRLTVVVSPRVC